jgi:MFS-type transporter involved in bile tolerance (Atg22 family)
MPVLICYIFHHAGFTTITSTAVLFGKTTLHMQPSALILVGVLTPTSGIIGSLVWPVFQRRYKWSNLKVLIILVILASLMPAYGCFGFLPILKGKGRFGGLTTQGELFGLAVFFGWYFCFADTIKFIGSSRICLWRVSKLCKGILCGVIATRRRSKMASLL